MIKASVTTAHLSYRFPILKLPPPPCAVLLVLMVFLGVLDFLGNIFVQPLWVVFNINDP